MGTKDPNYYTLQHRQKGQLLRDYGIRIHHGRRSIDVEDFYTAEQQNILEGLAEKGLQPFAAAVKIIAPRVYAAADPVDSLEELRQLFLNDPHGPGSGF